MEKMREEERPGYCFDLCEFLPGVEAACLTKLSQCGGKTEAVEKQEPSVSQCTGTILTEIVKVWQMETERGLARMWAPEIFFKSGSRKKKIGNKRRNTQNFQDTARTCLVFSFPGTWESRDDRGQQGGGRVPPIGQTNTLHSQLTANNKTAISLSWPCVSRVLSMSDPSPRIHEWIIHRMILNSNIQNQSCIGEPSTVQVTHRYIHRLEDFPFTFKTWKKTTAWQCVCQRIKLKSSVNWVCRACRVTHRVIKWVC